MTSELQITIPAAILLDLIRQATSATPLLLSGFFTGIRDDGYGEAAIAAGSPPPDGSRVAFQVTDKFQHPVSMGLPDSTVAILELGRGIREGRARGWVRTGAGQWIAATRLFVPGPHLAAYPLFPGGRIELPAPDAIAIHSRTRAALGPENHETLTGLRFAIVGLGRIGTTVIEALAKLGAKHLTIVDPDYVEQSNLGESKIFSSDAVGVLKAHAVENHLALHYPDLQVAAYPTSITQAAAQRAVSRADVIISCADHAAPRLICGWLAATWQRSLLDVGTRILNPVEAQGGESSTAIMGADVRIILPGDGCIICCGGVGGPEELDHARRIIASPDAEARYLQSRDSLADRPGGSLASLNALATGLAMRMMEDAVAGRIHRSLWQRADFRLDGTLRTATLAPEPQPSCFCHLAGWMRQATGRLLENLH